MLMMLDIADALPLILERSGRRTELQIPTMLALIFAFRSLWLQFRDGYPIREKANRNCRNHGVGRGVDDRDGVDFYISYVGTRKGGLEGIGGDSYPNRHSRNSRGRGRGVCR